MKTRLRREGGRFNVKDMSTVELLEQVKALSGPERRKFVTSVLALETTGSARRSLKARRVKWPDVRARAQRIFGRRTLPNLVLLERDEEAH